MSSKQRFILLGLLGFFTASTLVCGHAAAFIMGQLGMQDLPHWGLTELSTSRLAGAAVAIVLIGALTQWPTSRRWLGEVTDELSRVNWPSRQETGHATLVVVVCVVVSAAFLGLFDATWLWLSSTIMGVSGS